MNVIIIEDEVTARDYLVSILQQHFPGLTIAACCNNVPDAVTAIEKWTPGIVYLDVEIKQGTGFDVLRQVGQVNFDVIFTTAFNSFALEAFRFHAVDYLLKPLQEKLVAEATHKCLERAEHQASASRITELLARMQQLVISPKRLPIPGPDGIEFVDTADLLYAEANGNYTDLWMKGGQKITLSRKLKLMEEALPASRFYRIHHSYIVNIDYVKKYYRGRNGYVVLLNDVSLPVSSSRKDSFMDWLK